MIWCKHNFKHIAHLWKYQCSECNLSMTEGVYEYVAELKDRIALLDAAIREHREECWLGREVADMFDRQLYAVLQEQDHE